MGIVFSIITAVVSLIGMLVVLSNLHLLLDTHKRLIAKTANEAEIADKAQLWEEIRRLRDKMGEQETLFYTRFREMDATISDLRQENLKLRELLLTHGVLHKSETQTETTLDYSVRTP